MIIQFTFEVLNQGCPIILLNSPLQTFLILLFGPPKEQKGFQQGNRIPNKDANIHENKTQLRRYCF